MFLCGFSDFEIDVLFRSRLPHFAEASRGWQTCSGEEDINGSSSMNAYIRDLVYKGIL